MRFIFAVSPALFLLTVTSDVVAQDYGAVQDQWTACLNTAHTANVKSRMTPALAADKAFEACAAEEEQLWQMSAAAGVPREAFDNLKAAMKDVLLDGK